MRASVSGFGPLLVILALAGCASEKEKDFRSEANAICSAAQKRLNGLAKPSSLAEIRSVTKRELAVRQEVIDQLGELVPPIDISGGVDAVFQDLENRQERARAREKAAKDKDRKELHKLEEEARMETPSETYRADAVGLNRCAGI